MPNPRYYCDFCDKSFADNTSNRRNHLNGINHKILRADYYSKFSSPEEILAKNVNKNSCRKFMQEGACPYGTSCKYSHLTSQDKEYFSSLIRNSFKENNSKYFLEDVSLHQILSSWFLKHEGNKNLLPQKSEFQEGKTFQLPPHIEQLSWKPPSLLPYSLNISSEESSWG